MRLGQFPRVAGDYEKVNGREHHVWKSNVALGHRMSYILIATLVAHSLDVIFSL